jgi:hypothetical protein
MAFAMMHAKPRSVIGGCCVSDDGDFLSHERSSAIVSAAGEQLVWATLKQCGPRAVLSRLSASSGGPDCMHS